MPKFLDNIEFYTEGYNTESLTINKETKPISLNEDWNKETVNLEIPSTTITYPAEDPTKKRITDISRDIKKEKDEAIYKIEELSKSGLNATNKLVQKGLTKINEAGTHWIGTLGIDAFVNFRDSHNNIENGAGTGSLVQKRLRSDGVTWTTAKAYQGASTAFGGGTQAGRTEAEFNSYFWDSTKNIPINGGKGKNSDGKILDNNGLTYEKSYSYAVAEGDSTKALGRSSHAEGQQTQAIGASSHSEGLLTKSLGTTSHAEGSKSETVGNNSHAEGTQTIAQGYSSHSEGNISKSIGDNSHSEGYNNQSVGTNSHAEGSDTIANGLNAHTEGWLSKADGDFSHVEGYKSSVKKTQYVVPEGTGGGSGVTGDAGDSGSDWVMDDHRGEGSHAEGILTQSSGYVSHSEGLRTVADGHYSHAEGQSTYTKGLASHAEGNKSTALGYAAHAEGNNTTASGNSSHSEGYDTTSSGEGSHAEGLDTTASGDGSHAEGNISNASGIFSHAEGKDTVASKAFSHAEGLGSIASGNTSHAEGSNSVASGQSSHSEGSSTQAIGGAAHAEGAQTTASHNASHSEGYQTRTSAMNQHVGGQYNDDNSNALFIIGNGASDNDRKNAFEVLADGRATIQTAPQYTNDVANKGYVDDGWNDFNLENGEGKTALQQKRDASYTGIAIKTKNPNAYALDNTLTDNEPIGATGDYASSFGGASSAQGKRSLAEGTNTVAKGRYSHAEGCNSVTLGDDSHAEGGLTVAGAIAAHSEGWETQAVEEYSHAEGYRTIAAGSGSHAEGGMTYANAKYSHTEGVGNKSATVLPEQGGGGGGTEPPPTESESPDELLGAYAHAEGIYNTVYGYGSHAEGQGNIVYGHRSHAEGRNTVAGRINSRANGSKKVAGECIHTEGFNTVASGDYSHAEGANTKAIGAYSHAAGGNTEAHRAYSTAIGFYTTTEGGANCSLVTGKYNIKGYSNALFAVGNGSSDTDRKNAFTVLEDGRAKIQTTPSEIDDVVNKGYVDGSGMQGTGDPPLQGYNKDKGTIEERLTNLGFKELQTSIKESIVVSGATYNGPIGSITLQSKTTYREGNMARLSLSISFSSQILNLNEENQFYEFYFNSAVAGIPGIIPENYRPTSNYIFTVYGRINVELRNGSDLLVTRIVDAIPIKCTVKTSGDIALQIYTPLTASTSSGVVSDSHTRREIAGQTQNCYIGYPVRPYVSE